MRARDPGSARQRRTRDRLARRPALRVARGAVVGTSIAALAAAGHSLGGGAVDGGALVLATVVSIAAAVALADREWTLVRLVAVLAVGQVGVHLLLQTGHGAGHGAGHGSGTAAAVAEGSPGAAMLLAHVVALLVTAAALRQGEDLLWRVLRSLTSPLLRDLVPAMATPVTPVLVGAGVVLGRATRTRYSVVRRGPPALHGA